MDDFHRHDQQQRDGRKKGRPAGQFPHSRSSRLRDPIEETESWQVLPEKNLI
jgi:hypothetical protein